MGHQVYCLQIQYDFCSKRSRHSLSCPHRSQEQPLRREFEGPQDLVPQASPGGLRPSTFSRFKNRLKEKKTEHMNQKKTEIDIDFVCIYFCGKTHLNRRVDLLVLPSRFLRVFCKLLGDRMPRDQQRYPQQYI